MDKQYPDVWSLTVSHNSSPTNAFYVVHASLLPQHPAQNGHSYMSIMRAMPTYIEGRYRTRHTSTRSEAL